MNEALTHICFKSPKGSGIKGSQGRERMRACEGTCGNTLTFAEVASTLSLTSHTLAALCYKQIPSEAASASARLKVSAKLLLSIPRKDLTQGNTSLDFFFFFLRKENVLSKVSHKV